MFQSIADDIKQQFAYGNRITRLIIVNTAVFIAIQLVRLFFTLIAGFDTGAGFSDMIRYLALNSDLVFDVTHPWVFVTHMFVHVGFWHFLFNMLLLYWFGRITGDLLGDRRIYALYGMAGLFGAILYLLTAPLINPGGSIAYGASAAVMGIIVAAGAIAPDYIMRLLLIGDVKLKYIVLFLVLIDLFGVGSASNAGGHIAHLGGAAFGFLFVSMLRQGTDITEPVNRLFERIGHAFSARRTEHRRGTMTVSHKAGKSTKGSRREPRPATEQERIDAILDKIKAKGYDSLTEEEKEFLFQASKK